MIYKWRLTYGNHLIFVTLYILTIEVLNTSFVIALFRYVFSVEIVRNIADFFMKALGFKTDGTINYIFSALILVLIICGLAGGSYTAYPPYRIEIKRGRFMIGIKKEI